MDRILTINAGSLNEGAALAPARLAAGA